MAMDDGRAVGTGAGWRSEVVFLRRVLITLAVLALALLLWTARDALLLVFAAVLVAVLLVTAARPLRRYLGLSRGWALLLAGGLIAAVVLLVLLLVGSEIQSQIGILGARLPEAVDAFERRFGVEVPVLGEGGAPPAEVRGAAQQAASLASDLARQAASTGAMLLSALSALVLAVVGGCYLAADPGIYRRGLVKLLPISQQQRVGAALVASGRALRLWLRAQLIGMVMVGLLVGLGAWAIGLPAPLALGLVAALAEFVPLIGPVAAAVPGLLLALGQGTETVLWTLALYTLVQQIESNMLMPVLGEKMVQVPPALLLFAVVAAGAVLGLGGVLLAAPLTVVGFVLVSKLYVRETLGEEAVVPGEKPQDP